MRKIIVFLLFTFHCSLFTLCNAQIISTYAGNGIQGYSGDGGQAIDAELYFPETVLLNKSGNMYVSEANRVEMIMMSTGIINRIAGGGSHLGFANGIADTDASFSVVGFIALDDSGNVYIPDLSEFIVYKVTVSTGIITIAAGLGGSLNMGYSGDGGPATAAKLDDPSAAAVDDTGNLYIADESNNVIRKVTKSTGIITTVVGNGYGYWHGAGTYTGGYTGDGGPATMAELHGPVDLVFDTADNMYIADIENNVIRKVIASTGIINTVVGNGIMGYSGDGGQATLAEMSHPSGLSLDSIGNIYITDFNSVVRKVTVSTGIISTIAGNGVAGYGGNGGPATAAELNYPATVNFNKAGNLFIADGGNNVIRKVTYDTDTVTGVNKLTTTRGEVKVFPNPSNGIFNLYLSNISNRCNMEIFNYLGENIYNTKINSGNTEINLGGEPNGVYLYRVVKENGSLIGEGKIVLER